MQLVAGLLVGWSIVLIGRWGLHRFNHRLHDVAGALTTHLRRSRGRWRMPAKTLHVNNNHTDAYIKRILLQFQHAFGGRPSICLMHTDDAVWLTPLTTPTSPAWKAYMGFIMTG